MSLQSSLFRGDSKLEAAAVSNSAHITPGAIGPHVAKIQQALIQIDGPPIAPGELASQTFGPATSKAVLAYKTKRSIINRSYQTQADNIVGIMTMAALDRELQDQIDPVVIIGNFVAALPGRISPLRAATTAGLVSAPAISGPVSIRSVIRGNPYVSARAVPADMPDSVPPTKTYEVQVSVEPPLTGTNQFIELSIINSSNDNGRATIAPTRITKSQTVVITGGDQTKPGNAGKLQVQATFGGVVKATSSGFSVCSHPLNVEETFARDINTDVAVGFILRVTVQSDSGAFSNLDEVEWSEVVEQFRKDEPPFKQGSGFANNSGFEAIIPPKKGLSITDTHDEPRPEAGPKGISNRIQLHIFNCKRCGAINKVVPNSGYDIVHEVFQDSSTKLFKHKVTKTGAKIGIRPKGMPVFNATAGSAIKCVSPVHDLQK